jgi:hypothetical protein
VFYGITRFIDRFLGDEVPVCIKLAGTELILSKKKSFRLELCSRNMDRRDECFLILDGLFNTNKRSRFFLIF